jgi:hypothetical protein
MLRDAARSSRSVGLSAMVLLGASSLLVSTSASADETANARALYDQGSAAYNSGDFARAAALLAEADSAAPNPMVLGLAIGASVEAGDAVLGEDLALRADARGGAADLSAAATRAHALFQARVARVRIVCAAGRAERAERDCVASLGPMRWKGGELHAAAPGIVDVVFDGGASHVRIAVAAGKVADLVQPPPSVAPLAPALLAHSPLVKETPRPSGISPAWFWGGLAVTAGLAIGAGVSGANTHSLHDDFLASPSQNLESEGESAQRRTNILIGAAVVSAAATATVGLLLTRWRAAPVSVATLSGPFLW